MSSAYRAARFVRTARSAIVMLRKPGPDTSTSSITSPVVMRETTSVASSRGLAFAFFASARIPLAWKSARSLRRSSGSADASGRVAKRADVSCLLTRSVSDVTEAMEWVPFSSWVQIDRVSIPRG